MTSQRVEGKGKWKGKISMKKIGEKVMHGKDSVDRLDQLIDWIKFNYIVLINNLINNLIDWMQSDN
jgi:hypothetical protein